MHKHTRDIYTIGCIDRLKQAMEEVVTPLVLGWVVTGLVTAFAEVVMLLLCLLFFWSLKQKEKEGNLGRSALQRTNSTGKWEQMPLRYTSTVNVNISMNGR